MERQHITVKPFVDEQTLKNARVQLGTFNNTNKQPITNGDLFAPRVIRVYRVFNSLFVIYQI